MDRTKKQLQGAARVARHRSKSVTVTLPAEVGNQLLQIADHYGVKIDARNRGTRLAAAVQLLISLTSKPTVLSLRPVEAAKLLLEKFNGSGPAARDEYMQELTVAYPGFKFSGNYRMCGEELDEPHRKYKSFAVEVNRQLKGQGI